MLHTVELCKWKDLQALEGSCMTVAVHAENNLWFKRLCSACQMCWFWSTCSSAQISGCSFLEGEDYLTKHYLEEGRLNCNKPDVHSLLCDGLPDYIKSNFCLRHCLCVCMSWVFMSTRMRSKIFKLRGGSKWNSDVVFALNRAQRDHRPGSYYNDGGEYCWQQ